MVRAIHILFYLKFLWAYYFNQHNGLQNSPVTSFESILNRTLGGLEKGKFRRINAMMHTIDYPKLNSSDFVTTEQTFIAHRSKAFLYTWNVLFRHVGSDSFIRKFNICIFLRWQGLKHKFFIANKT